MLICSVGLFLTDFLHIFYPYFLLVTLTMVIESEDYAALSYVTLFVTTFLINFFSSQMKRFSSYYLNIIKIKSNNLVRGVIFKQYSYCKFGSMRSQDGFYVHKLLENDLRKGVEYLLLVPKIIAFVMCFLLIFVLGVIHIGYPFMILTFPLLLLSVLVYQITRRIK